MKTDRVTTILTGLACAIWLAACAQNQALTKRQATTAGKNRAPAPACGAAANSAPAARNGDSAPAAPAVAAAPGGLVLVEFYVMSKCPFAAQVEQLIVPVLAKMGKRVAFRLDFIGRGTGDGFQSLHGESEVQGDKIQLCAAKLFPASFMKMVLCMNESQRSIPDGWRTCANRADIAAEPIAACADGPDGAALLTESFKRSSARRARGSPTMYFGGKRYDGPRGEQAFARAICRAFGDEPPALCADLPKPARVPIIILTDSRCTKCRADRFSAAFENMFPGAEIRVVDFMTPEGKALYAALGPERLLLPAILFDHAVEQVENYTRIGRMLVARGNYLLLRSGSTFDPTREICDNGRDDTGNGKIDCEDPDCADVMVCRPEKPAQLEVFIMSHCPFAVRGLDAMSEILDQFGGDLMFSIHYIATAEGEGFRSLHGQGEVDENIRELCVMKHYPQIHKFMSYIWCRDKNIRSDDWQECTGSNGIDRATVAKCADGQEGRRLLSQDIPLAESLEIRGSPTWVVNGRYKFNGIDAATIRKNFCEHNPKLSACRL